MTHPNLELIDRFFDAYGQRDVAALREVLAEEAQWVFPGQNPLGGPKVGAEAIVAFFDAMGGVMASSKFSVEKLVQGVSDGYVAECQHVVIDRGQGLKLDHQWCVLWTFANGKIVEGRHLAADQQAVDAFFSQVLQN